MVKCLTECSLASTGIVAVDNGRKKHSFDSYKVDQEGGWAAKLIAAIIFRFNERKKANERANVRKHVYHLD